MAFAKGADSEKGAEAVSCHDGFESNIVAAHRQAVFLGYPFEKSLFAEDNRDTMSIRLTPDIIQKFDVPGPRYTSYPTAPQWTSDFDAKAYERVLQKGSQSLSLYVHVPFCVSMCYYCGCTVTIRKDKASVGDQFLDYLEKEVAMVAKALGTRRPVRQFHIGGGTPNFLTAVQLTRLVGIMRAAFDFESGLEQAIEIDPRTVTPDIPEVLAALGFNRISMGIQDFDPDVQTAINRIQPYDMVATLFEALRAAGISSINADLIYGLPRQHTVQFAKTIDQILQLRPDRIALYSYAHVPWLKSHQRLIKPEDMPDPAAKMGLFLTASQALSSGGYQAIAMDHFALDTDDMAKAYREGRLYRNFMGYTLKPADDYIGFGPSAIGHMQGHYAQNFKEIKAYYEALDQQVFPIERGLAMSADDRIRQWVIQALMCQFRVDKVEFEALFGVSCDTYFADLTVHLAYCTQAGLLLISDEAWGVTAFGRFFVRNICMGFDAYFKSAQSENRFSRTI